MEEDFRRIDTHAALVLGTQATQVADQAAQANDQAPAGGDGLHLPHPAPNRKEKRWVVFHGRNPGIYDDG